MKTIVLLCNLCIFTSGIAQISPAYWQKTNSPATRLPLPAEATSQVFRLDLLQLQTILQQKSAALALPLPDGSFETLQLEETAVLPPGLAVRYPAIRTFRGGSVAKKIRVHLDISPQGFHAMLEKDGRTVYIDPLKNQTGTYLSYYADEVENSAADNCAALPDHHILDETENLVQNRDSSFERRVYRLAVAATGEFVQRFGGTTESALATIASAVNRLNHIYERELGVTFQLIADNDRLLFTHPTTDPFPTTDNVAEILAKSAAIFTDSLQLSFDQYDLGHTLVVNCAGANGTAYPGSLCNNQRAGGVTCFTSNDLDGVVTSIFAHEIAHQFVASHTFSASCNPAQVAWEMEPGCGHTIMSYNITDKLPYFHGVSLEQMTKLVRIRNAAGCGTSVSTENQHIPNLTVRSPQFKIIPNQTPFELVAIATDADGDSLTYSWEQIDNGSPVYRSYAPTTDSIKSFPPLPELLRGVYTFPEIPAARAFNFRCTVRDNAGGVTWKDVQYQVQRSGESFQVLYPNSDTVRWLGGSQVEVRWKAAGTSQKINVRLSLDGGYTYPVLLAKEVPNNGLAVINLPEISSERARVRVEAADNLFFNISNHNFRIDPATEPTFQVDATPRSVNGHCSGAPLQFTIQTLPIQNFTGEIMLDLEGNLPPGTTFAFLPSRVRAGQSSMLTLYFVESTSNVVNIKVKATAATGVQRSIPLQFSFSRQEVTEFHAVEPNSLQLYHDGSRFSWILSGNVLKTEFEIATSPTFGETVVYRTETNRLFAQIEPNIRFASNRLYFWRVRPMYDCGPGTYSATQVFSTDISCRRYPIKDTIRVNDYSLDFLFPVENTGAVRSVTFDPMMILNIGIGEEQSPKMNLTSPSGRSIRLLDRHCPLLNVFLTIYFPERQTGRSFACSQIDSNSFANILPAEPFSLLQGDSLAGIWRVRLEYPTNLDSMQVEAQITLHLCKQLTLSPTWNRRGSLSVAPRQVKTITQQELKTSDPSHNDTHLFYLIIAPPQYGQLLLNGQPLQVGDWFTQQDINDLRLQYRSESAVAGSDGFNFLVQNAAGRITYIETFPIKIQQLSALTNEPASSFTFDVFPNPTKEVLHLQFQSPQNKSGTLRLYNARGQQALQQFFTKADEQISLQVSQLPSGVYFLTVQTAAGVTTRKVVVQR
jgi:hypothetical protein